MDRKPPTPVPSTREMQLPDTGGSFRLLDHPGDTPPLCALHGFSGSADDFALVSDALGHRLLAPDLPGHGPGEQSDIAGNASMEASARRIDQALRHLGERSSVLLGYSMGGRAALSYAVRNPERVRGLVLVSASPGLADPEEAAERRDRDETLAASIVDDGMDLFAQRWEEHPIIRSQQRIPSPHREALQSRRRSSSPAGLAASLREMGTGTMAPLWGQLDQLDFPVLVITGEEDTRFGSIARRMLTHLPQASHVVVPWAGHCCHLEQASATAVTLRGFLRKLGA